MCKRVRARAYIYSVCCMYTYSAAAFFVNNLFLCVFGRQMVYDVWVWKTVLDKWMNERDREMLVWNSLLTDCGTPQLYYNTLYYILFDIWFMCSVSSVWLESLSLSRSMIQILRCLHSIMGAERSRIKVD